MQEPTAPPGQGRRVVVVEDNVRSRRLVRDLLELRGFVVIEAESAEDGLEAVRLHRPALVLLDIQLPGLDGEAALPVAAVTAYAMRGDEERLLAAGFDAYFAKPIDTRTFVERLLEIVDARAS
jgi:CheY-like chemotaxis protein